MDHVVILAGKGELPWIAADNLVVSGHTVNIFCLTDALPPRKFRQICTRVHITRFYTEILKSLRKLKPNKILMLGKINRDLLYKNGIFDRRTLLLLRKLSGQSDYQLFLALATLIEKESVEIVQQNVYLPDCSFPCGRYGSSLDARDLQDVSLALIHSRKLNELDVGQSVVVCQGAVIALEASEGTDACIRRAGQILGEKRGIVCKMAKLRHDLRFDMPTVGTHTLAAMSRANCRVLVIHERKTIVVRPKVFQKKAAAYGITILSLPRTRITLPELKKLQRRERVLSE